MNQAVREIGLSRLDAYFLCSTKAEYNNIIDDIVVFHQSFASTQALLIPMAWVGL